MAFDTNNGTTGASQPGGPLLRLVNAVVGRLVARRGKMPGRGHTDALVLITVGRKTGQERRTPVMWFPADDGSWLVVASAAGAPKNPAWYLNLAGNPEQVAVELSNERIPVTATQLHGDERAAAWADIARRSDQFAGYQARTDRELPVIRLSRKTA